MPSNFNQPYDSLTNVSEKIREILQDADYGENLIHDDPRRFAALLADKLGVMDRGKLKSIRIALAADIYTEILKAVRAGANYRSFGLNSAKTLQKTNNLSEADSYDVIDFLLIALGETPIKGVQHRSLPTLEDIVTAVKIEVLKYDGDGAHPPTLGTSFYQDEVRQIGFILHYTRPFKTRINTTCHFEFFDSIGSSISQQQSSPCTIDDQSGRIAYAWGGDHSGHWKPDKYTIRVRIGYSNTVVAKFEIKKNQVSSPEPFVNNNNPPPPRAQHIDHSNGDYYIGDIVNGQRHGHGIYFFVNGDWLDGNWVNNEFTGQNIFFNKQDERTDTGDFCDGIRVGSGVMQWANGDRYEGEWNDNGPHGYGTHFYSDGNWKEGNWIYGRLTGQASAYIREQNRLDTGEFSDGNRVGRGVMQWASGDRYEGEWNNNGPHGYGTHFHSDGSIDKGEFSDGNRAGRGVIQLVNGDKYEGEWNNNGSHGYGTYFHSDGSIDKGEFSDGNRAGRGVIQLVNGDKYEGEWNNNGPHGYGKHLGSDGSWMEGNWLNGRLTGHATVYNREQHRLDTGEFLNGRRVGRGTMQWANGDSYEGKWKDDNNGLPNGSGTFYLADGYVQEGKWVGGRWVSSSW